MTKKFKQSKTNKWTDRLRFCRFQFNRLHKQN